MSNHHARANSKFACTRSATGYAVGQVFVGSGSTAAFDLNKYYYYVQIDMTRSASGVGVEIAAVEINSVFCL